MANESNQVHKRENITNLFEQGKVGHSCLFWFNQKVENVEL